MMVTFLMGLCWNLEDSCDLFMAQTWGRKGVRSWKWDIERELIEM